nr:uncharacterized protein LOC120366027 [Saimiri boliviensis boliviensis]
MARGGVPGWTRLVARTGETTAAEKRQSGVRPGVPWWPGPASQLWLLLRGLILLRKLGKTRSVGRPGEELNGVGGKAAGGGGAPWPEGPALRRRAESCAAGLRAPRTERASLLLINRRPRTDLVVFSCTNSFLTYALHGLARIMSPCTERRRAEPGIQEVKPHTQAQAPELCTRAGPSLAPALQGEALLSLRKGDENSAQRLLWPSLPLPLWRAKARESWLSRL